MPCAVRGASTHLPLDLPPLLGSPTLTPQARVARKPSTARFFRDGEVATAVAGLSSSSFLFRWARLSSLAFFSFSFSSFLCCRCRASYCFRNSRSAFSCSFRRCLSVFPFGLGVCGPGCSCYWNSGWLVLGHCVTLHHSPSSSLSPFSDACLQQIPHISCTVGTLRQYTPCAIQGDKQVDTVKTDHVGAVAVVPTGSAMHPYP